MPRTEIHPSVKAVAYFEAAPLAEAEITLAHAKETIRRRQVAEGKTEAKKRPGPKKKDAPASTNAVVTDLQG